MSQDYGMAVPSNPQHDVQPRPRPARYLVVIDSGGTALARLFLATREQVAEFDAGAEEVSSMSDGLAAQQTANASEWDQALAGHSAAERSAAKVYTLDI